ncbi:MAG: hypothetical protein ACRDTA_19850 [Pseudonocardiaceae bacterium]
MSVRWLIDKSVLARTGTPQMARVLAPRIDGGLIAVSVVTELEVGFSARSASDHDDILRLVERGQHRAVGVADLLVAPAAKEAGLTVLHYDGDWSAGVESASLDLAEECRQVGYQQHRACGSLLSRIAPGGCARTRTRCRRPCVESCFLTRWLREVS